MSITAEKQKTTAFQLKGSLFTLTVLQLIQSNLEAFQNQLQETLAKAPKFFKYAPIILDVNDFEDLENFDLAAIVEIMRSHELIPVGIRGGDKAVQQRASAIGLAIMMNSTSNNFDQYENKSKNVAKTTAAETEQVKINPKPDQNVTPENSTFNTKVITQPVRSGQQIYAKGGDLIVLAPVSHGAEILADGHIHVYGPLRGRALAGIMGNEEAKIFCSSLEAELISIAGRYLVSEQLGDYKDKTGLHIFLENDQLLIRDV